MIRRGIGRERLERSFGGFCECVLGAWSKWKQYMALVPPEVQGPARSPGHSKTSFSPARRTWTTADLVCSMYVRI
jgi:hypothetical protein